MNDRKCRAILAEAVLLLNEGYTEDTRYSSPFALFSPTGECAWPAKDCDKTELDPDAVRAAIPSEIASFSARMITLDGGSKVVCIPITSEHGLIGYLISRPEDDTEALDQVEMQLAIVGQLLDAALESQQTALSLAAELSDRYEELNLIYDVSDALHLDFERRASLKALFEPMYEALQVDSIHLYVPTLNRYAHYPNVPEDEERISRLLETAIQRQVETGMTTVVNHVEADDAFSCYADFMTHLIGARIDIDGDPGVLLTYRQGDLRRFYMCDVRMVESMARQFSIFLTNEKVDAARQDLFHSTIFGLARLAESRDKETGAHLERTSTYCKLLAEHLMEKEVFPDVIDQEFVDSIFRSSPLHDIGKVGIPDSVLLKPGKLTAEEFEVMKEHTVIGGNTLQDIEERLHWAGRTHLTLGKEIAYAHHEKWDGSGYPYGLAGEDIPLAARIMALADVYDALSSRRCYKEAFSIQKVRAIILEGQGKHFDPRLVDAFLALEDQFAEIRGKLSD